MVWPLKRTNTKLLSHFLESILIAFRMLSRRRSKELHKIQRVGEPSPRLSVPRTKSCQPLRWLLKLLQAELLNLEPRMVHTSRFTQGPGIS